MKLFFASFAIALCVFVQTSFAIPPNYVVTTTTGVSIVPGTTDIGNHCDDCVTNGVSMPFAFTFYDQTFTSVNISSNGNLQFSSSHNDTSSCAAFDGINVIAPGWTDLWTAGTGAGQGVFTSVSGSFPNRIFNIEWRVTYCCGDNGPPTVNFEARLYEGEQRIDFIYGANSGVNGVGVQRDTGSQFTSVGCGVAPASGTQYTFRPADCVTPPTNMVGWFPGDNNTIDLINGNNATLHNGAGYGPGEVSGAFNFDGVDDYVSFGSTLGNFGTGNFTVDFWIRTTSTRDEEIIGKRPVCNHASRSEERR